MNQPSNVAYAHAAGLLLGEGCICIYKRTKQNKYSVRIWLGMKDAGTVRWLQETFGGGISKKANKAGMWAWWKEGRIIVHEFLRAVEPYMRHSTEKYGQVLIAMLFCTAPHRSHTSQAENAKIMSYLKMLHDAIRDLKPRNNVAKQTQFVVNLLKEPIYL